jgi:hypothetical protein
MGANTSSKYLKVVIIVFALLIVIGGVGAYVWSVYRENNSVHTLSATASSTNGKVLLGVAILHDDQDAPAEENDFSGLESTLGAKLGLNSIYDSWPELGDSTNNTLVAWDAQNHIITMFSWRPTITDTSNNNGTCATESDIIAGKYDAQITQQATTLKNYGVPILLRWNYEMTDNYYNSRPIHCCGRDKRFVGMGTICGSLFRGKGKQCS